MPKIIQKYCICFFFIFFLPQAVLALDKQEKPGLLIFYAPTCHKCNVVKAQIMPAIEKEFVRQVTFVYLDLTNQENYKLLLGLIQKTGSKVEFKIPIFYMQGRFLNSEGEVGLNLRRFIKDALRKPFLNLNLMPADLVAYFKDFVPLSIIIAGLEDGINPCAFTVIVFFMSFLALQGYRKRELLFIGAAFIFSVFLTYLCIGLGIFNFLYRFRGFWAVTHLLNMVVGGASILFGIFAIYDFIKFRKTGATGQLILQLPEPVKERIHKVVGFFYRKGSKNKQERPSVGLNQLILSALVTGFLISLLEAVCTGQVYLPTIAFVLKTSSFRLQALGYLLLYNIMFIIPLIVIFIFALMGTTSAQFSGFLKKHLGIIKLCMAALFFGLGIFLIWRG